MKARRRLHNAAPDTILSHEQGTKKAPNRKRERTHAFVSHIKNIMRLVYCFDCVVVQILFKQNNVVSYFVTWTYLLKTGIVISNSNTIYT
jgi:hypothetical protein